MNLCASPPVYTTRSTVDKVCLVSDCEAYMFDLHRGVVSGMLALRNSSSRANVSLVCAISLTQRSLGIRSSLNRSRALVPLIVRSIRHAWFGGMVPPPTEYRGSGACLVF